MSTGIAAIGNPNNLFHLVDSDGKPLCKNITYSNSQLFGDIWFDTAYDAYLALRTDPILKKYACLKCSQNHYFRGKHIKDL